MIVWGFNMSGERGSFLIGVWGLGRFALAFAAVSAQESWPGRPGSGLRGKYGDPRSLISALLVWGRAPAYGVRISILGFADCRETVAGPVAILANAFVHGFQL